MKMKKSTRWILAIGMLLLIPVTWRITVITAWEPEIFGAYSLGRALLNIAVTVALLAGIYLLLGKKETRHKLLSLTATLITTLICLFILEVPVLFFGFDYQKLMGTGNSRITLHLSEGVNKPDPVLIQLHWPNSSFSGEVFGNLAQFGIPRPPRHKVDVKYDHNGFRNDRNYTQANVAVIGDSFVEAAIVPYEKSIVKQLEARLNTTTVNLGQIAYGFQQEMEVLRRYGLKMSPKLVIWVLFGGNDLRDVEAYEYLRKQVGKPVPKEPLQKRLFIRNILVASSNVFNSKFRTQPTRKALDHSGLYKRADGKRERVYFSQSNESYNPYQWKVATETLSEARTISNKAGAEFVVVYIPRKFRIYRDHLEVTPGTFISKWTLNNLPSDLEKWCRENNMHFVNLTPELQKSVASGVHPYFIDDVHWNELGHRIAADQVTTYLKKNGLFPFRQQETGK